jgi:hypothetical protein
MRLAASHDLADIAAASSDLPYRQAIPGQTAP